METVFYLQTLSIKLFTNRISYVLKNYVAFKKQKVLMDNLKWKTFQSCCLKREHIVNSSKLILSSWKLNLTSICIVDEAKNCTLIQLSYRLVTENHRLNDEILKLKEYKPEEPSEVLKRKLKNAEKELQGKDHLISSLQEKVHANFSNIISYKTMYLTCDTASGNQWFAEGQITAWGPLHFQDYFNRNCSGADQNVAIQSPTRNIHLG